MKLEAPKGWFVEMLEQIATQPALLKAAAAGPDPEWDQRRGTLDAEKWSGKDHLATEP